MATPEQRKILFGLFDDLLKSQQPQRDTERDKMISDADLTPGQKATAGKVGLGLTPRATSRTEALQDTSLTPKDISRAQRIFLDLEPGEPPIRTPSQAFGDTLAAVDERIRTDVASPEDFAGLERLRKSKERPLSIADSLSREVEIGELFIREKFRKGEELAPRERKIAEKLYGADAFGVPGQKKAEKEAADKEAAELKKYEAALEGISKVNKEVSDIAKKAALPPDEGGIALTPKQRSEIDESHRKRLSIHRRAKTRYEKVATKKLIGQLNKLHPPAQFKGKIARDTRTDVRLWSDGKTWRLME